MSFVSFAQNREDVLLHRLFSDQPGGFYIDVGAAHPVFHSVTKLFYNLGWHGVNIEPVPLLFEMLREDRPRDVNLNMGLSNHEGTLTFYEVPGQIGSSTFCAGQAEVLRRDGFEIVERSIPVTTLTRVCEQYAPPTIDFLKIDVENYERQVLEGGNWSQWRPRLLVIEATEPSTPIPNHEHWVLLILAADYHFALSLPQPHVTRKSHTQSWPYATFRGRELAVPGN